jgi:uncharacterized membrane protein
LEINMLGYDWPRLHAALNDLPIALLLAAVLFDLLALATRRQSFRQVSFWTLIVGAVGGAAAVLSGLQAEEYISHGDAVHRVMETHELLGLVTLGVFGVLALWRLIRENRMASLERTLSVVLALAGAGVLFATGVYGGKLVFDHAAGIPTQVLQGELGERVKDHDHAAAQEHPAAPDSAAASPAVKTHADPPGTPPHSHSSDTPPHTD